MAEIEEKNEKKTPWWQNTVVDLKINTLKLSVITIAVVFVLILIIGFLLPFTPLREYFPGYADKTALEREVYALSRRADSIERELVRKDIYFKNLKMVIEGYDFSADSLEQKDIYAPLFSIDADTIELKHSSQDSALRAAFEEANLYRLNPTDDLVKTTVSKGAANFFAPLEGTVSKAYNPSEGHYGVDVVSTKNQVIKATLDGTVVYASWTLDYGYTLGIQHENNYFTTYKHNATLLRHEGDFVRAGEAIAILGASGELGDGPMLHFELWHNGTPMNPTDYISFEDER